MNNLHPWQLKKIIFWGQFWSHQLNSTANSAYSLLKEAKWSVLAVLFSWQQQNDPHDSDFNFQWPWWPIIHVSFISIVHEVPQLFMHDKSILGGVYVCMVISTDFEEFRGGVQKLA